MIKSNQFWRATIALWSLGAAWPSLYGLLTQLLRSPLERALVSAWCGAAPHAGSEFLGHCAACWVGVAAFLFAGVLVLELNRQRPRPAAI